MDELENLAMGICCGQCNGELFMKTCPKHDFILSTECFKCGLVTELDCPECGKVKP